MTRPARISVTLLLLALIVAGILRLRFDVEVLNLLPAEIPAVKGLKVYQEHFANARELIVTVESTSREEAENAARAIAQELRGHSNLVSEATWQPPWLESPGQSAELIAYLWLNQPPDVFSELTNRLNATQAAQTLANIREQLATSMSPGDIARLSYDPFGFTQLPANVSGAAPSFGEGEELFSSADGKFRIVFVQPASELKSYRDSARWLNAVKTVVQSTREKNQITPTVNIGYTGGPAFVAEISGGMESDLTKSVGSTIAIIILLFWWAHRRLKPLFWLLALLGVVLGGTLAIGGLIFGAVNVVSIGFAAILLGLAVDYGLVLYQEALHAPGLSARELRHLLAPSIIWSAVTTSGAFLILNFGGLPGLAQLGSFVAIGIALAAFVMLNFYLPPLLKTVERSRTKTETHFSNSASGKNARPVLTWTVTAFITLAALLVLSQKRPPLDHTPNSLRPKKSSAYDAMEKIKANLSRNQEPDWLIVSGASATQVANRLSELQPVLARAQTNQEIANFTLPTSLVPRPEFQSANRVTARSLAEQLDVLREVATNNGFTSASLAFTENVLNTFARTAGTTNTFWPQNPVSRWVIEKTMARDATNIYTLGLVYPIKSSSGDQPTNWEEELETQNAKSETHVWIAGWERLSADLLAVIERDFWRVMIPMAALLLFSLWLAFKRASEVILSLATLAFSGLCLWAFMGLLGWSWNLLNLLAIPLLLGAGVDYSIHLQLGLRRHGGDIAATKQTIGRAVMLCAGTTVAGFGSNAFSSNAGLESLGLVCAAGIGFAFVTAYFLLPVWWQTFAGKTEVAEIAVPNATDESGTSPDKFEAEPDPHPPKHKKQISAPSSLYRSELWRIGLWIVRFIPRQVCLFIGFYATELYWRIAPERREIVIRNLLPALQNDRAVATKKAKRLFHQFAIKVVDLWRYEAGLPIENSFGNATGWKEFIKAQEQKRGVLLLTPHLGNWEFGGPWLTQRGMTLYVVTLAEPGDKFTELRQKSRARWNIETLVIGNDPFAFVEIIRKLEAGAIVALLIDRPTHAGTVPVELFGQRFHASVAAAELARASGCALLPVCLPREGDSYAAHVLPEISYDRTALRDPAARQELTQQIVRAFEPEIQKYLDQWYHFIPVWPEKTNRVSDHKPMHAALP